ncbi:mitochondrial import receptor subunit TOM20 homolog [Chrysoperla carnea]|uniref:mitochondrial import receptor subunit TOM20 homolog n=1 Tax=Chrysoperla carnea TaxID=189513 RepID=UPI001D069255|nr:mitochondrial import receptor subunit TOM20 homolog [Chrysoperla carnea]
MVVTRALKVFSGIVVTLFLGYCIYFDRVRHSDPCFRTKLRQRRQRERDRENQEFRCPVPPKCIENRQIYFLEQISLGEKMLTSGYVADSVCHFANAVAICPNPNQLICALRVTLPEDIFKKLQNRLAHMKIDRCCIGRN